MYDIEKQCRNKSSEQRNEYRNEHSRPILEVFRKWLDEEAVRVLSKSPMGNVIRYAVRQWHKTIRVLEDGRLEMDNNLVETCLQAVMMQHKGLQ